MTENRSMPMGALDTWRVLVHYERHSHAVADAGGGWAEAEGTPGHRPPQSYTARAVQPTSPEGD